MTLYHAFPIAHTISSRLYTRWVDLTQLPSNEVVPTTQIPREQRKTWNQGIRFRETHLSSWNQTWQLEYQYLMDKHMKTEKHMYAEIFQCHFQVYHPYTP